MNNIQFWNQMPKPEECNTPALENDLVFEIDNTIVLVQRKNAVNNIILFKNKPGTLKLKAFCEKLYRLLIAHGIQYIRVEGNSRRYFFLLKLKKYFPGMNTIQVDEKAGRNVFYCKLY